MKSIHLLARLAVLIGIGYLQPGFAASDEELEKFLEDERKQQEKINKAAENPFSEENPYVEPPPELFVNCGDRLTNNGSGGRKINTITFSRTECAVSEQQDKSKK